QHLHEEPEVRSLPEAERPVVARALAKDPEKRWPNCLAFVRALYTAQSSAILTNKTAEAPGERPKTMADTMEDVLLEQEADEVVHELPPKPAEDEEAEVSHLSHLGLTVAQPQTGVLRPTLVIGLGEFGRQALLELRCRILDRFGDLAKIPLIHLLYVDCDA